MLKELAKCSKLQSLEIIEASVIHDSDLAEFSHGKVKSSHFDKSKTFFYQVRHVLSKLVIKFWSDTAHVKELCENQAPRKLAQGFTTGGDGRVRLPRCCPERDQNFHFFFFQKEIKTFTFFFVSWAIFLLNCRKLTEVQWFEPVQLR